MVRLARLSPGMEFDRVGQAQAIHRLWKRDDFDLIDHGIRIDLDGVVDANGDEVEDDERKTPFIEYCEVIPRRVSFSRSVRFLR